MRARLDRVAPSVTTAQYRVESPARGLCGNVRVLVYRCKLSGCFNDPTETTVFRQTPSAARECRQGFLGRTIMGQFGFGACLVTALALNATSFAAPNATKPQSEKPDSDREKPDERRFEPYRFPRPCRPISSTNSTTRATWSMPRTHRSRCCTIMSRRSFAEPAISAAEAGNA